MRKPINQEMHAGESGAEFVSIQQKPGTSPFLRIAREITLSHHGKWNGPGYPRGLSGGDIPLSVRRMATADVYGALISKRVYKKAFIPGKTIEIIKESKGTHFDSEAADGFPCCCGTMPAGASACRRV